MTAPGPPPPGGEVLVGLHAVAEAVANPAREKRLLLATDAGLRALGRELRRRGAKRPDARTERRSPEGFQEAAGRLCGDLGPGRRRVPGGLLLLASPTPVRDGAWLAGLAARGGPLGLVALDGATDVRNVGAVLRSAAFFGASALVLGDRGFRVRPGLALAAAGALEHVPLALVPSLPRTLAGLAGAGVATVGLCGDGGPAGGAPADGRVCLVLGAEDRGLSPAVRRRVLGTAALRGAGPVQSLNVSVAAALAMGLFFDGGGFGAGSGGAGVSP